MLFITDSFHMIFSLFGLFRASAAGFPSFRDYSGLPPQDSLSSGIIPGSHRGIPSLPGLFRASAAGFPFLLQVPADRCDHFILAALKENVQYPFRLPIIGRILFRLGQNRQMLRHGQGKGNQGGDRSQRLVESGTVHGPLKKPVQVPKNIRTRNRSI